MTDRFNEGALRLAVAQICQSMGWDSVQKSTHDLLTEVMQKYMEEIAKSAHEYCQLYCHTEPNLDDLGLAFNDTGVLLNELEDYVSQVDQVPFIHQLPRFPLPKSCLLHHPMSGEIEDRDEYYHDHLPPLSKGLQPNEDEKEGTSTENKELDNGFAQPFLTREIKTVAEETHNELISNTAEKRSLGSPPEFEVEAKRRRLEGPFLGKNNKENELEILKALQENISQSPSPSPDILPMEIDDKGDGGVFKFAPNPAPASKVVLSLPVKKETTSKPLKEKKLPTPVATLKSPEPAKAAAGVTKPSPSRKKSPQKTVKPKSKASPKVKSKSPSPMKSPIKSPLSSPTPVQTAVDPPKAVASPKKTSKKAKVKSAKRISAPASKIKSPPLQEKEKTPPPKILPPVKIKEEVPEHVPQAMPKLIIKPVKQEKSNVAEYSVAEMLASVPILQESKVKGKHSQKESKKSGEPKPKKKKKKEGASMKTEPGVSGGSLFSIANFLPSGSGGADQPGEVIKKKKKKHKDKDKDKQKSKDKDKIKIKKIKQEPLPDFPYDAPSTSTAAIPRIKLKLEPPAAQTSSTDMGGVKESKKSSAKKSASHSDKEPKSKKTSSHTTTKAGASHELPVPPVHIKQEFSKSPTPEPGLNTSATPSTSAGQSAEGISRMVITETLSSTVQLYFCPACGFADDGSFMIGCDNCDKWYHGACVGILDDPGGDWFCTVCAAKKAKKKKKKKSKGKDKLKTM